jgi:hypothetical protein
VTEGNSGIVSAVFTVTLSASSDQTVTVNYATADGTATASDGDYSAASASLTFGPGMTVQTFSIQVNGDILDETDEIFFVNLTNPTNALLINDQAVGTIIDDDTAVDIFQLCIGAPRDAYFREDRPTQNYNNDNTVETDPDPASRYQAIIEFDLAAIPANSNITTATLYLYEEQTQAGQTINLHRVTNSWNDSEVTWLQRMAGVPWSAPGGDYAGSSEASFAPDVANQYRQIDLTTVTQGWVDGTFANYGLLLRATGSAGGVKFRSGDDNPNKQPQLCVSYSVGSGFLLPAEEKRFFLPMIMR